MIMAHCSTRLESVWDDLSAIEVAEPTNVRRSHQSDYTAPVFRGAQSMGMTGLHAHRGMKRECQRRGYREVIRRDIPASTE